MKFFYNNIIENKVGNILGNMSFCEKICTIDDIIYIIFKCSSTNTKTALPSTCKTLYNLLKSKTKFALNQDSLRCKLNSNNILKINCVNIDCHDIGGCIGYSTFVYLDDKITINKEISRYIPYCKNCTHKHVNYGDTFMKLIIHNKEKMTYYIIYSI